MVRQGSAIKPMSPEKTKAHPSHPMRFSTLRMQIQEQVVFLNAPRGPALALLRLRVAGFGLAASWGADGEFTRSTKELAVVGSQGVRV